MGDRFEGTCLIFFVAIATLTFNQVWFTDPLRLKIELVIKHVNRVVGVIRLAYMCHKSLPLEALFADVSAAELPPRISCVCL